MLWTQTRICGLYRWMTVTPSIMPSESSTVPWARAYRHLPWEQGNSNQRYSDDAPTIRTVEPVHVHTQLAAGSGHDSEKHHIHTGQHEIV